MGFEFQKLLFSSSYGYGLLRAKLHLTAADEYHQEYPVTLLLLLLLLFYLFDDRYFSSQKNWSLCILLSQHVVRSSGAVSLFVNDHLSLSLAKCPIKKLS